MGLGFFLILQCSVRGVSPWSSHDLRRRTWNHPPMVWLGTHPSRDDSMPVLPEWASRPSPNRRSLIKRALTVEQGESSVPRKDLRLDTCTGNCTHLSTQHTDSYKQNMYTVECLQCYVTLQPQTTIVVTQVARAGTITVASYPTASASRTMTCGVSVPYAAAVSYDSLCATGLMRDNIYGYAELARELIEFKTEQSKI